MKNLETSENTSTVNHFSKEKNNNMKGREKIDSWIDDIIKQHKQRSFLFLIINQ